MKNKKTIIICVLLIVLVFVIYILSLNKMGEEYNTEDYKYLKNYGSNEIVPVYVTQEDIVKKYINEYKNNMLYDIEEAYNSLNASYRAKRFSNLEGYKNYVNDIMSLSTLSMEVDKYSVTTIGSNKIFNVYDKNGFQYIIKEKSIMNYEIYLDENTVVIE